jgi:hypothetical protein
MGFVIWAYCWRDKEVFIVYTIGSSMVTMVVLGFCRTGRVDGGSGSWVGVKKVSCLFDAAT